MSTEEINLLQKFFQYAGACGYYFTSYADLMNFVGGYTTDEEKQESKDPAVRHLLSIVVAIQQRPHFFKKMAANMMFVGQELAFNPYPKKFKYHKNQ